MGGHNFGWKTFWDSNPDWSCLRLRLAAKFRHSGEAAMPGKSAGRAPSLRIIPWHSPHNRGKKHGEKKPQSELPKDSWTIFSMSPWPPLSKHDKFADPGLPWDA